MRRLLPLLLALALAVAACGGSSSGGAGGSGDATSPTAPPSGPLTGATAAPGTVGGSGPLAATKTYADLSRNHSTTPVRYRQTPPVGGDHAPEWASCGAYDGAIDPMYGVHSMEHGAVWVTYRPSLPAS